MPQPTLNTLAANIVHFARTLRAAGLPVGTAQVINALEAAQASGLKNREDFYWSLHAPLTRRQEDHALFDQAFALCWRNPKLLERARGIDLSEALAGDTGPPQETDVPEHTTTPGSRRLIEALAASTNTEVQSTQEIRKGTYSLTEGLATKDFEQMSTEEMAEAHRAVERLVLDLPRLPTRRLKPHPGGKAINRRASFRAALRPGGDLLLLKRAMPKKTPPPIVALCDISGSMAAYSRVLLLFLHALSLRQPNVHSFTFGTRLTNITRSLKQRDADEALALIGHQITDWSGGTRIGKTIETFNREWSRRVLPSNATLLFISDGIDRDAGEGLDHAMDRLSHSCRRLIWLNPLLRYDKFAPKAAGIRAILPHVDELRPIHNLQSIMDLTRALTAPDAGRDQMKWKAAS